MRHFKICILPMFSECIYSFGVTLVDAVLYDVRKDTESDARFVLCRVWFTAFGIFMTIFESWRHVVTDDRDADVSQQVKASVFVK